MTYIKLHIKSLLVHILVKSHKYTIDTIDDLPDLHINMKAVEGVMHSDYIASRHECSQRVPGGCNVILILPLLSHSARLSDKNINNKNKESIIISIDNITDNVGVKIIWLREYRKDEKRIIF